jgi:MerR family transcriptional regulator, thiopeptide resistance regulator
MTRLTLGQLAREVGLARSSLLHYEALGLLVPAGRSAGGYRLYDDAQRERLRAIRAYRAAGLPLAAIRGVLASPTDEAAHILEKHLLALNDEIARLRHRQKALAMLLAQPAFKRRGQARGKDAWVALLRRAGFDDADMDRWHAEFEAESPDSHAAFLVSLGMAPRAVQAIRRRARNAGGLSIGDA